MKKELAPHSIPFYEICRYTGRDGWPREREDFFEEEQLRCRRMRDFVDSLDDDWFLRPDAVIEPQYSSMYMQGLAARKRK